NSPVFGLVEEFLRWQPQTSDTDSRTLKGIKLYQELLRFHQDEADRSAFLDADLDRLTFGYNKAFGEQKNARYKAALQAFAEPNAQQERSGLARSRWTAVLQTDGDLVEARRVAQDGARAFPNSPGGQLCANAVKDIEAPSYQIVTERAWNNPWPTITVHY